MKKTLGALLGRRSSKLITLMEHSITRATLLKNRHRSVLSCSLSDISQLLELGHREQALCRVEHVMRTKNMLDTLDLIESYCHLLLHRVSLIDGSKDCPEELKEAISSLTFASRMIGEFPELQHIREFFASKYGKEYESQATNRNFGVNDKIIQKLSTRKSSIETRINFLREISSEHGIPLNLDGYVQQQ